MMYLDREQAEIENKGNRKDLGGKWGIKVVEKFGRDESYPGTYYQTYRIGKAPMRYFLLDIFNQKARRATGKNNFSTLAHAKKWAEQNHGKLKWTSQDNLNADQSITKWYFGVDTNSDSNYPVVEIRHTSQPGITPLRDEYILKNPKRRKKMAKKKRSKKQLANDKRLGRMAKARAKANRGGARKKTVRKKTRRKVVKRRANPKRTRSAKSHLWIVFGCTPKRELYYLTVGGISKPQVQVTGTKSDAILFKTKSQASHMVHVTQKIWAKDLIFGICNENATPAEIKKACFAGK